MNALHVLIPALCVMALAYRYYSAFLATRVAVLDPARVTPAHIKYGSTRSGQAGFVPAGAPRA